MYSYQPPFYSSPSASLKDRLRNFIRDKSTLNRLIVINVSVFFLYFIVNLIFKTVLFLSGDRLFGNSANVARMPSFFQSSYNEAVDLYYFSFSSYQFLAPFFQCDNAFGCREDIS